MTEYLFARLTDVDAQAAIDARDEAVAAQQAAENAQSAAENAKTDAETAQGLAENAQAAAEAAQQAAENAADNFDDVYLGSKAADPTLDNDGNPLVEGQLYWNSSSNQLMIYDGAAWNGYNPQPGIASLLEDTSPQLGGDLETLDFDILMGAGDLIFGATGDVRVYGDDTGGMNFWLTGSAAGWTFRDDAGGADRVVIDRATGAITSTGKLTQAGNLVYDVGDFTIADYLTITAAADAYQPLSTNLTEWAGINPSADGASLVAAADYAAMKVLLAIAQADVSGLTTASSPQFAGIELGHATDNTLTAASGVLSIEGTPIYKAGRESIYIPAASWAPTITNGAGRSYTELATNDIISETLDFDTTTQEFATCELVLPQKWNAGTLTYRYRWRATAGTPAETVDMALSAVAISNDDAEDAAPGTPVVVSDALIATDDHHVSAESTAVTIAGTPAKADKIVLKLQRDVSTDNLAADAMLEGVEIFWTSDAATDV